MHGQDSYEALYSRRPNKLGRLVKDMHMQQMAIWWWRVFSVMSTCTMQLAANESLCAALFVATRSLPPVASLFLLYTLTTDRDAGVDEDAALADEAKEMNQILSSTPHDG